MKIRLSNNIYPPLIPRETCLNVIKGERGFGSDEYFSEEKGISSTIADRKYEYIRGTK